MDAKPAFADAHSAVTSAKEGDQELCAQGRKDGVGSIVGRPLGLTLWLEAKLPVNIQKTAPDQAESAAPKRAVKNARGGVRKRAGAGYHRSRLNAVKHGLAAQTLLLPGEDREELERLHEEYYEDFAPAGAFAAGLVEDLVTIVWKQRRYARAELACFREVIVQEFLNLVEPDEGVNFSVNFHKFTVNPLFKVMPEVMYEQLFGTPLWFGSHSEVDKLKALLSDLLKKNAHQSGALDKAVSKLPPGLQLLWEMALRSPKIFEPFATRHRLSPEEIIDNDWVDFRNWISSFALPYIEWFDKGYVASREFRQHCLQLANAKAMKDLESLSRYDTQLWIRRREITAILVRLREN